MGRTAEAPKFALDESLWFGDGDDAEAESRAAASLAAVGARIVGAKPFPIAARRLDELTRNPSTRIEQVVTVLESDPALSARLLRLVNSAGYGLKVRCTSVRHAAVLVGTRRLNQVATTAAILDLFDGTNQIGMELLEHASVVGSLCRYLAVHLGLPHDELFTCGFLHDIGKLMLLDAERERYADLLAEFGSAPDQMHLAERRMFGFDHAVLGAHVLAAWNIPEPVPRVIAWHHSPARAMQDTVIAAMVETLRLADMLAYVLPMQDSRLAIEITAGSEAARYLDISDVQLAAMWDDLLGLRERSRARSHGEPELDVMVPRDDTESLAPKTSRRPSFVRSSQTGTRPSSRPLQEVPVHFPCSVCGKPSYAHTCAACGGQVCPEHQVGLDEWCTTCAREFTKFKKNERPTTLVRAGAGLLVGTTLSIAVVSAVRLPNSSFETWIAAPLMVLALWAVVLPVAYRLWHKLAFLNRRRGAAALGSLPVARQQVTPLESLSPPREALATVGPPSSEIRAAQPVSSDGSRTDYASEPALSVAPLSMAPLSHHSLPPSDGIFSMAPASIPPTSMAPPSSGRMRVPYSLTPQSVAPPAPSAAALTSAPVNPRILEHASYSPTRMPEVSLLPDEYHTVPPRIAVAPIDSFPPQNASIQPSASLSPRISVREEVATPSLLAAAESVPPRAAVSAASVEPAVVAGADEAAPSSLDNGPARRRGRKARRGGRAGRNLDGAASRPEPSVESVPKTVESPVATSTLLSLESALPALQEPESPNAPESAIGAVAPRSEVESLAPESAVAPIEDAEDAGPSSSSGPRLVVRPAVDVQMNSPIQRALSVGCAARSLSACVGGGGPVSSYGTTPAARPGSRESA